MATNNNWNNQITAANSAITLNSGTNNVNISTDSSATTVSIATGSSAKTVAVGSTNTTSALNLNSGSGGIIATGVSGVSVANKNYVTINTSTGALGSDAGVSSQMVFISTQTASTSANLNFTSGITNTYGVYLVSFSAIRPVTGGATFQMLFSTNGGSTYLNSTYVSGYNSTAWNSATWLTNVNSTTLCPLMVNSAGPPSSMNGYFYIYNLASSNVTSYVGRCYGGNIQYITYGSCSTTSINAIRFQMSSGNISTGTVSLYGILNS